jgi:hypothetical protein
MDNCTNILETYNGAAGVADCVEDADQNVSEIKLPPAILIEEEQRDTVPIEQTADAIEHSLTLEGTVKLFESQPQSIGNEKNVVCRCADNNHRE